MRQAISSIKGKLVENNEARKADQKEKLTTVVKALKDRMNTMKQTLEKKSVIDQKRAV